MNLASRALCACLLVSTLSHATPITLDGAFDDWTGLTPAASDALGDDGNSGIDFDRVWFTNDARYVFMRFQTGADVQGDEQQSMRLYMDTDMNASTGTSYDGIGADLVWNFGERRGTFRGSTVYHDDLGMLLGPTVSSTQFEIAFRLDAAPAGGNALFPGEQVRWILRDTASNGDRIPNSGAQTSTIRQTVPDDPSIPLDRFANDHLRLVSFNVLQNGIFEGGSRQAAYDRALNVIDSDIWVFNEVWDFDADATRDRVAALQPAGAGLTWDAVKRDSGNVIVSRYPIIDSWDVYPGSRLTAARIDLDGFSDRDILVIAAHLSCCSADANRQDQSDALIAFVRDARTPGGQIDLPEDTPIVAAGDFNLVGWSRQLETLLTGDIFDEGSFGPDSAPDWDGSGFELPPSTHNDQRVAYTWRNDGSSFLPGLLDFTFYTGSVVELGNHYVFDTRTMTTARLNDAGLFASDSDLLSDHNPRILDLDLSVATDAPSLRTGLQLEATPNPFNPRTTFSFRLDARSDVEIVVYDAQGRRVRSLMNAPMGAGLHAITWDGTDDTGRAVSSGNYHVRAQAGGEVETRGVTLVK